MHVKRHLFDTYSLLNVGRTLCLAGILLLLTILCSFTASRADATTPPSEPRDPHPENGSTNVSITTNLRWTGATPNDQLPVTYDVFFGTTNPPPQQASNFSNTTYIPGTLAYYTCYYWRIIAWDNLSASTSGPLWSFTTLEDPNNPPNMPSSPDPANQSTGVPVDVVLRWTGGDPDNDTVTYDVYCGNTSHPPKVAANHSTTTYDPPGVISYDTTYYWRIIARDNHSTSTAGPLWHFTTKTATITVAITKPLENTMYFRDEPLMNLTNRTFIYGPLTITANATADAGVALVAFYLNGVVQGNDTTPPYTYTWDSKRCFHGLSLKHTITVVAIDTLGHNASASINVTKWRFHPLPFVLAAAAGIAAVTSTLIAHTTIRGFVFNPTFRII